MIKLTKIGKSTRTEATYTATTPAGTEYRIVFEAKLNGWNFGPVEDKDAWDFARTLTEVRVAIGNPLADSTRALTRTQREAADRAAKVAIAEQEQAQVQPVGETKQQRKNRLRREARAAAKVA